MLFVFRVDASAEIGSGHAMRCLTLAEGLREVGGRSVFICRAHQGDACDLIADRGFSAIRLSTGDPGLSGYEKWLGRSEMEDAAETRAAIASLDAIPDWLIADHYAIGSAWEKAIRPHVGRIMVIDDLADRQHDCDLLLDQNLVANFENRYSGLTPKKTALLLGPKYALLQPEYATLRARVRPRQEVRRLLIYFGAADRSNLTGIALSALAALGRNDIAADVVVSRASPHSGDIAREAARHGNVTVHHDVRSLAPIMLAADLAIGAAGATSWERLCLGLRSIVVILAENQRPIAEELDRRGIAVSLGDADKVGLNDFQRVIGSELARETAGLESPLLVDGLGADRVAAVLTVVGNTPMKLRPAVATDETLLLAWANDSETRANSFCQDTISADDHRRWFAARLDTPHCHIFIAETARDVPVGQVRFELKAGVWAIGYSIAPEFRGRGLAKRLLGSAASELAKQVPVGVIVGEVSERNEASRRVFGALGYAATLGPNGVTRYEKRL